MRIAVCRTELFREIIRKKAEPSIPIESVPDATFFYFQQKTDTLTFVALRPSECEEFSRKGLTEYFVKTTCKIRGTAGKMRHASRLDSMPGSGGRKNPRKNSLHTKGLYCAGHETHIDSVQREIYDTYKAALPMHQAAGGSQTMCRRIR